MKYRIFSIFCIFSIFWIPVSYAEESCNKSSCPVVDGAPESLEKYFEDVETVLGNITSAMGKASGKTKNSQSDVKKVVVSSFNQAKTFKEYYGSFDFWMQTGISGRLPAPVKRDYKRVEELNENLKKIIENVAKSGVGASAVEDICDGVKNCDFQDGVSVENALASLLRNNARVVLVFQSVVLERPALMPDEPVYFTDSTFIADMQKNYSKSVIEQCKKCQDGTLSNSFQEKIKNITSFQNGYKKGVASWKAAWAMLKGKKMDPNYQQQERELLSNYLSNQGIKSEQADIVLGNLDRYNESGLESNPVTNTARSTTENIKQEQKTFSQTLEELMKDQEKIPYTAIPLVDAEKQSTEQIAQSFDTIYQELKPMAFSQDVVSYEIQARILRMHNALIQSVNLLDKSKKISKNVCEKAGPEGNCEILE